jgi:acyl dehydratase
VTDAQQDHAAAVAEFLRRTRELIGLESGEDVPPPGLATGSATHVPAALVLDEETMRRFALSIGDDNPLFTDPAYAQASPYGALVAPGPILAHVRYPADHGATRAHGYPLANFIASVAWEFFDVIRAGSRLSSSKKLREILERRGRGGRLIVQLVSEVVYFDAERPLATAYGSLIQVPTESMGAHRAMPPELLGESLFVERGPHRYSPSEAKALSSAMDAEQRRGAEPLHWEDVGVGDDLPPIVQPPYTLRDAIAYQAVHQGLFAGYTGGRFARAFTPAYRAHRAGWGYPDFARIHPVTGWPYTPGDEHEDAYLCAYRGQPLPFDFGIQRAQIPQRLVSNWAGDAGFCRRLAVTIRRPLFYGDAFIVTGKVVAKSVTPDPAPHGVARHAVRIAVDGTNQRNELVSRGYATVYLPSRETGRIELPIGHDAPPPYVPFREQMAPSRF